MNKFRTILLIAGIMVAGVAFDAAAQKAERTAGARAAYGYQPSDKHYKSMKKKSGKNRNKKNSEARRKKKSTETGAAYRRRGFIM